MQDVACIVGAAAQSASVRNVSGEKIVP